MCLVNPTSSISIFIRAPHKQNKGYPNFDLCRRQGFKISQIEGAALRHQKLYRGKCVGPWDTTISIFSLGPALYLFVGE